MRVMQEWIGKAAVVVLLGAVGLATAGTTTFVWTGARSANWSDGANWTNRAAPGCSGTDSVWLMRGGVAPTNQDIDGLFIDTLLFNTNAAGFAVGGRPITLKRIACYDEDVHYETYDPGIFQTNRFDCDVVMAENNGWDIRPRSYLWFNGSLGETNGPKQLLGWGGSIILSGTNTFSGGLNNNSAVFFMEDRNLGALPAHAVSNYFQCGWGRWRAMSTGGVSRVTIHANRGISIPCGRPVLAAESNVRLVVQAPLCTTNGITFGDSYHEVAGDGVIELAARSPDFSGLTDIFAGTLVLMQEGALGGATNSDLTGSGTLDLHGHDLVQNLPNIWNCSGADNRGFIINSDTQHPARLLGRITFTFEGGSLPFGGPGELVLCGQIVSTNGGRLCKTGGGTLTIKGVNSCSTDTSIHGGGLTLDYRAHNCNKVGPEAALNLTHTSLALLGSDSAATRQSVGTLAIGGEYGVPAGASSIRLYPGLNQELALAVTNLSVAEGNAVDFQLARNGGGTATLNLPLEDRLIAGGCATWNRSTWATCFGRQVAGFPESGYQRSFNGTTATSHVDVAAGVTTLTNTVTAQTLRFNAPAGSAVIINEGLTLALNGIDWPQPQQRMGILMTATAGPCSIRGPGNIKSGYNQVFTVHQYSPHALTLGTIFSGNGSGVSLVKCGPGELVLATTNSLSGGTAIFGGTVSVNSLADYGHACALGAGEEGVLIAGGTFRYTGPSQSHDRQVRIRGGATIDASGPGVLRFTAPCAVLVAGDGNDYPLTLAGTGVGQIDGFLDLHFGGVIKDGAGTWILGGEQPYLGDTLVMGGTLRLSNSCELARNLLVMPGGTLAGRGTAQADIVLKGTRRVELRGDADYDTLAAGWDMTLGGRLEIVEVAGYRMPAAARMTLMTAGATLAGEFTSITEGFSVTRSDDGKRILLLRR